MSNIDNLTPASTLTPSVTTTPSVQATQVETNQFTLNSYTVDGITSDINSADPTKLLTSYGAYKELSEIYQDIAELTSRVDNIEVLPVLSDPMLPTNFIGNDWFLYGWYLDNGKAIYISNGDNADNQVKIKTDAITVIGNYYLHIKVDRIDGGTLVVKNENNEILGSTSVNGDFKLTIAIEDASISTLTFEAQNVPKDGQIVLGYAGLHHVKSAFEEYIEFTAEIILSGGSGFVTKDMLEVGLNNILTESKKYTNDLAGNTAALVSEHLASSNPHRITPEKIGAALRIHLHEQYAEKTEVTQSLSDLKTVLTKYVDTSVSDAISTSSTNTTNALNKHISDKNNPHDTTPEKIGAAPVVHEHRYTDGSLIGVAKEKHTHQTDDIEGLQDTIDAAKNAVEFVDSMSSFIIDHVAEFEVIEQKVEDLVSTVDIHRTEITEIDDTLSKHLIDYNNPHQTTKETIGLDKIVNGPMATDQEAIDGELNDVYMNPRNNRVVLDNFSGTAEKLAQTLTPKLVLNRNVTVKTDPETNKIIPTVINLATSGSRIYQVLINFESTIGETSLAFRYNVLEPYFEYEYDDNGNQILDENGEPVKIFRPELDPYIKHTSLTEHLTSSNIDSIVSTKNIVDKETGEITGTEEVVNIEPITYMTISRRNNAIGFADSTCLNPVCDLTINLKDLTVCGEYIGYRVTEEEREVDVEEDIDVPEYKGDIIDPTTTVEEVVEDTTEPKEPVMELVNIYRVVHGNLYGKGIILQGKREDIGIPGISISFGGNANVRVYELVATPQNPGIVVDASPIGNIITRLGDVYIPGYSLLDGSQILIANHQKLYDYAVDAGLVVDKLIYDQELADNGYTTNFGYEEGSNYFFLPMDPVTTDKYRRYIKIDDLYVPTEKQLIYRYAWS